MKTGRKETHGHCPRNGKRSPEWTAWNHMKRRCTNPNYDYYQNYGGRGITICEKWMRFEGFLEDMGAKPSQRHSLDRIDNDGNYEPGNCRWATPEEQAKNRRPRKPGRRVGVNRKTRRLMATGDATLTDDDKQKK